MIGQTVSHYKILEKLGEGGMGVVYKAHDTTLDRDIALKFLPHHLTATADEQARFLQEARAASALNHPNICAIYSIGEEGENQFIEMEFVDGKTLRQLVPIQKTQVAIDYAIQIGEALQEAHSKGIVHRDVKADNIMVNSKNQIKVMDFGLAKLKGSLKLTKTSSTVGTLAYMAPEQIQGGEVDSRSDIFSFGVVLFEMLTGHLPFRGEHEAAMMYSIVNEEATPLQQYLADASSELVHIMNRSLEKDPENRYQTVHDMVIDLMRLKKETSRILRTVTDWRSSEEPRSSEVPPRPSKKTLMLISTLGVVLLIVAVITFFVLPSRPLRVNPNLSIRTLTVPFTQINYPSMSRDGSWVAFAASDVNNEWSIYFMNLTKGAPRRMTTEAFAEVGYAEISPDNSEVLYDRWPPGGKHGVYVISSNGGTGRRVAEPARCPRWRPDGQLIGYMKNRDDAESGKREFWTVKPDGTENHLEFTDSANYFFGTTLCFDWSPDGKSIAWLRSYPAFGEIFIRDLGSGNERQLTSYKKEIDEITWASNGQMFFCSSKGGNTNIWMIPAKGGEAVQITKGSGPDLGVRVSADGKRLLFLEKRQMRYLWTARLDGTNARQLTFDDQGLEFPKFSPDNSRISFHSTSSDILQPGSHVFTVQNDGTNRAQITAGDGWHQYATWSPDGKYMAYSSTRIGEPWDSSRVYLIETSNPGTPKFAGRGILPWWIDKERFVIFFPPPRFHTFLCSIHDLEPIEVSGDSTMYFPFRDGKQTLLWDSRKGREGWWLKSVGAGQGAVPKQILSSEYVWSAWPTVSLRYLLYLQANRELWRISLPGGNREQFPDIFRGQDPFPGDIQLSFDDKEVIYSKGRLDARLILIENPFE